MQEMQTAIILLTIIVSLLSIGNLVLFVVVIALLVKLKGAVSQIDRTMSNVAQATQWLAPSKIISEIAQLFRK